MTFPPSIPFTCQVTRVSAVPWTVAVYWTVRRVRTALLEGDTATDTGVLLITEMFNAAETWLSGF